MDISTLLTKNSLSFHHQVLKGISQIMLQENVITGLLILTGIFYGSPVMGIAAITAAACGTAAALLFKFNADDVNKGLYGFSAALVGVAIVTFFKAQWWMWVLIPVGSVAATTIQHLFIKRNIPAFTLPFVVVSWVAVYGAKLYFPDTLLSNIPADVSEANSFDYALRGFGQVIFQDYTVSGALFFIAVFISTPIAALYGLAAATLASVVSCQLAYPAVDIQHGLFAFNAVLCAITFAGSKLTDGLWVLLATAVSLLATYLLLNYNVIQLTFPFVVASVITTYLKAGLLSGSK